MNPQTISDSTWPIQLARLFPPQGQWSVEDYLRLTDQTRQLVELVDGRIEIPEMPTETHQLIVQFLFLAFHEHIAAEGLGTLVFAPIRVRTIDDRYREPDLAFMLTEHADRRGNAYWQAADLVVEVVSADDASRQRDWSDKKSEYAEAGIDEYWIVDPQQQRIVVHFREATKYVELGSYRPGQRAQSKLLPGFSVDVTKTLNAR